MTNLDITIETIDARKADAYIGKNTSVNRPVNKGNLARIVSDMNAGRFKDNGDPIRFNQHGELIDGQHRLLAILSTNKVYDFVVVRNIPEDAMKTIDTGSARTPAQLLKISGIAENNHSGLAAIARAVVMYKYDKTQVSKAEIVDFVADNEDHLQLALHLAKPCQKLFKGAIGAYGSAAFLLAEIDQDGASEFFKSLAEGAGLEAGSPILALRNYLTNSNPLKSSTKWGLMESLHPVFTAWNQWRNGKQIRQLRVNRRGFSVPK